MDQLINEVSQKTGISQDQARTAVNTVLNFIKAKLPPSMASQVDSLIGSSGSTSGSTSGQMTNVGDMAKGVEDMFGGNK